MTADDALLHRARAGDGQAFAEFAEPHRRELPRRCQRVALRETRPFTEVTAESAW